jgi:putative oxidoreductase
MDRFLKSFGMLAGRLAIAFIFLSAAYKHFQDFKGTLENMAGQMPFPEKVLEILLGLAITFLILGGLSVVLGFYTRFGALLLILFLVVATYFFHDFWTAAADQVQMQLIQFNKNLAIIGGLLILMGYGPGSASVDAIRFKSE